MHLRFLLSTIFAIIYSITVGISNLERTDIFLLQVNPHTHELKICDFGSAKMLVSLHIRTSVYISVASFYGIHCF